MRKQADPRLDRTKALFENALVQLMRTKNAHKITVKDLTGVARVSRSTFYAHYLDMPDFLEKKVAEITQGIVEFSGGLNPSQNQTEAVKNYTKWFEYIETKKDIFSVMLGTNGLPEFRQILIDQGITWYEKYLENRAYDLLASVDSKLAAYYIVSAHTGLIDFWLKDISAFTARQMAEQMVQLTFGATKRL